MKKIAKTSLIALAFVLFSCGKNEQYFDSYVGLIKEHTLRYKTNGLVLGDPQYVHFEDEKLYS